MDANGDKEKQATGPRACGTCAKAKARCIPCGNPFKCERCDRLNKPCSKQARVAAPPRPKKEQKPSKVAELEKRIADLSSRLNDDRPRVDRWPYSHILPPTETRQELAEGTMNTNGDQWPTNFPEAVADPRIPSRSVPTHNNGWPTGPEAAKLLSIYRAKLMPLFPFVVVQAGISAEQLEWERPFLHKAIMLEGCYKNSSRQLRLGRELLKEFTEAAFTRPRKSEDLLQGILVYLAWFHYGLSSFQVTNLLFLARSICVSLGLNENRREVKQEEQGQQNLDQMRAFAGTYYMTTNVFTTSKRPEALMGATYVDAVCRNIERRAAHPTDALLVNLVKIQQIAQGICVAVSLEQNEWQNQQSSILPFAMVRQSFQAQIDDFKTNLPPHLQDHDNLRAHAHIAELLLHEVVLQEQHPLARALQPTERLEVLWTMLNVAKAFLTLRFATSMQSSPRFLCVSTYDTMFAFFACLKLVNLQLLGWNLEVVRRHLDLGGVVDRQIADLDVFCTRREQKRDEAASLSQGDNHQDADPIRKLVAMLKAVKSVLEQSTTSMPMAGAAGAEVSMLTPPEWQSGGAGHLQDSGMASIPTTMSMWQEFMTDALWNSGSDWQEQNPPTPTSHYFPLAEMEVDGNLENGNPPF